MNGSRRSTGQAARPWPVADQFRPEFAGLMWEANQQARLVRKDVLRRMHPRLPDAFNDFILFTDYVATHAYASRPAPRHLQMWQRWSEWYQTHASDLRLPKSARP
jgi:hypothetical protein